MQIRLEEALREMGVSGEVKAKVEVPKNPQFGDLSTNVAFIVGPKLKLNPLEASHLVLKHLDQGPFQRVEIAEPGFINFFFKREEILKVLSWVLREGENFGSFNVGRGKHIQVEFVSSNPTGPLTLGHGRQAALGDVISRLYENLGYKVTREYYFNDEGRQIELLAKSLWARYQQQLGLDEEVPQGGYKGLYLAEIAKKLAREIGDRYKGCWNEEAFNYFKKKALEEMMAQIKEDLKKFRVKFDVWFTESSLHRLGVVEQTLKKLKQRGAIYVKEGAIWIRSTKWGAPKDRVLRKSDGNYTYLMTDIAYHLDKYERGFDWVLDIQGADHHSHSAVMKAAMRALGYTNFLKYLLHQFVTLKEEEKIKRMSTRGGEFITLRELMESLGCDVVRYFLIMMKPDQHLEFDYELAKKQSMENPVYYIQYAHTRIAGIFRKFKEIKAQGFHKLKEKEELDLIKKLDEFPQALRDGAENLAPHLLAGYAYKLASLFHLFYEKHRVLSSDEELSAARLALCRGVRIVLKKSLDIMGVEAPERM